MQSWRSWECVIVDDGSTDDTRRVVGTFLQNDTRFKYIYQHNHGLSAARNTGIDLCKGAYIQFLDADDMLQERKLETQVAYLESHPETDIVYGDVHYFNKSNELPVANQIGGIGETWMPRVSGTDEEVLYSLVRGNIMVVNAPLLRRSVVDDVDGFKRNLRSHEDWDYWIRCALAGKRFQYLGEDGALALVRVHHSSMSKDIVPMLTSNIKVREQLNDVLPSELCKENNYRIGEIFASIAKTEILSGKLGPGLKHLSLAIWRSHAHIRILAKLLTLFLPEKIADSLKSAARRMRM